MCPPKIDIPEPEVPDVPDPEETADTVKTSATTKEERTKTGVNQQGSLRSLRVDLNVPNAGQGQTTGANIPKG